VDDHAADVLAVADGLGLDRFVLGGLSMGGYVAFAVFRTAPERVLGLVLADTRADPDGPEARVTRARMRETLALDGAAGVADIMVPRLLGPTSLAERPALADWVRRQITRTSPAAIDDAIEVMLTRPDSRFDLERIGIPALVICGEEDALTPPDVHRGLHRALRISALAVLGRSGHLANLEAPEAFTMALHGFLTTIPAA
jgi:pimeloyl-ACP methyl ester carboxylesterase